MEGAEPVAARDDEIVDNPAPTNSPTSVSSPTVQAASAVCTVYISDVAFSIPQGFTWETAQICSGAFGLQRQRTQMLRSSWSGPRGYGPWTAWTPWSSNSFESYNWGIGCGSGGTYDYYPVMQGEATAIGVSPTVRSDNQEDQIACGTAP